MTIEERNKIFFETFFPLRHDGLSYLNFMVRDINLAEEILSSSFYKVLNHLDSYTVGTNPKAWLFRILHNQMINYKRRKDNQPKVELDSPEMQALASDGIYKEGYPTTFDEFEAGLNDEVRKALRSKLSEEERTLLYLDAVLELKQKEIAEIMDLNLGTVKSKLSRARKKVKTQLANFANTEYGIM